MNRVKGPFEDRHSVGEAIAMDKIFTTIISNLEKKGLSVIEIPRFLKDFYRIIERDHRNEMPVFIINHYGFHRNLFWLRIFIDEAK